MELDLAKAHINKFIPCLLPLTLLGSQSLLTSVWTSLVGCKSLLLVNLDSSAVAMIFDEMCGDSHSAQQG